MTKIMLIDTAQEEETRVAVLDGKKVEDFDFESSSRKPLRGNIYLARVTRVEPSLQAAFIEYGGNRHGFLAFSEIHPDYYQIPVSDREVLQQTEREMIELAAKLEIAQRGDEDGDDEVDEGENNNSTADEDIDLAGDNGEPDEDESPELESPEEAGTFEVAELNSEPEQPSTETLEVSESDTGIDDKEVDAQADKTEISAAHDETENTADISDDDESAGGSGTVAMATDRPNSISIPYSNGTGENTEDEQTDAEHTTKTDTIDFIEDANSETLEDQTEADIGDTRLDTSIETSTDNLDETDKDDHPLTENDDEGIIRSRSSDDAKDEDIFDAENIETESEDDHTDELSDDFDRGRNAPVDNPDADDDNAADEGDDDQSARREEHRALLDAYREARRKHMAILRNYKIQEVIKPRQIMLVQVVKEERGNKGAALTSYLSLAGRYCVLMPNTARGGGISRKIPNANDRKRLRRVVNDLDVTDGMGLIIRTAGAKRTKAEIKRDFDYLMRLWSNIRDLTLKSVAPCCIYEEASLIKRAIRDLYDKDISKVMVEGEAGYREAKDFMKMLMPSHAKNVQPYKDDRPLFLKYDVEQQLDAMYQPIVRLKSGGYLVINQTEALIAVDVNSGKATRERNIEATALKTNLEAAQEVARQCKLRDLAGLLVIDFIDMEENRNNRAVEKRLKDALKTDRARIQVGRISSFGLMEMSRQRRRSGIVDGTTHTCPTCAGSGAVRSDEMAALRILRAIEAAAIAGRAGVISAKTALDVALFILNNKRPWLDRIEKQYALTIEIVVDASKAGDLYEIEKRGVAREIKEAHQAIQPDQLLAPDERDEDAESLSKPDDEEETHRPKRRRRRRRRRNAENGDADHTQETSAEEIGESESIDAAEANNDDETDEASEDRPKRRRRRGRRGGRRQRNRDDRAEASDSASESNAETGEDPQPSSSFLEDDQGAQAESGKSGDVAPEMEDASSIETDHADGKNSSSMPAHKGHDLEDFINGAQPNMAEARSAEPGHPKTEVTSNEPTVTEDTITPEAAPEDRIPAKAKKARKGWWQRALGN